ncbi:MAG: hypothetical protein MZW92_02415 [Comamonadaceae bacterium]|nr:hypothetical protein [Comamonadaceae bacterium]
MIRLLALAALAVLVFYYVGFRSKRAVFLSFGVVLLGTLWSVGLMGIAGIRRLADQHRGATADPHLRQRVRDLRDERVLPGPGHRARRTDPLDRPTRWSAWRARSRWRSSPPSSDSSRCRSPTSGRPREFADRRELRLARLRPARALRAARGPLAAAPAARGSDPAPARGAAVPPDGPGGGCGRAPSPRLPRARPRGRGRVRRRPAHARLQHGRGHLLPAARSRAAGYVRADVEDWRLRRDPRHLGGARGHERLLPRPVRAAAGRRLEAAVRADPDVSWSISLASFLSDVRLAVDGTDELPDNRGVVLMFSRLLARAAGTGGGLLGGLADEGLNRVTMTLRIGNSDTGHFMDEQRFRTFLAGLRDAVAAHPAGEARPRSGATSCGISPSPTPCAGSSSRA